MSLYGRKYNLKFGGYEIKSGTGDNNLRFTFRIEKEFCHTPNYSEITVYNMRWDDALAVIDEGMHIQLYAGYEDGPFGLIFDGKVFQPMFDRENVVDFKYTFHCLDGLSYIMNNLISRTFDKDYTQADIVAEMLADSSTQIPQGYISEYLSQKKLARGKVVFGDVKEYLKEITEDNNTVGTMYDGKFHVYSYLDPITTPPYIIGPYPGSLIGVPQQIPMGVAFKCLLNPDIKIIPPMKVKLDTKLIIQMLQRQGELITPLDRGGTYRVFKVVHIGDTRGNDWYTEIIGVNQLGPLSGLLGEAVPAEDQNIQG